MADSKCMTDKSAAGVDPLNVSPMNLNGEAFPGSHDTLCSSQVSLHERV